jgi:hypothetical protein
MKARSMGHHAFNDNQGLQIVLALWHPKSMQLNACAVRDPPLAACPRSQAP